MLAWAQISEEMADKSLMVMGYGAGFYMRHWFDQRSH
jgi:hypothetical protein